MINTRNLRMFTGPVSSAVVLLVAISTQLPAIAEETTSNSIAAEVKGILRTRCSECHSGAATVTDFDCLDAASLIKSEMVIPGEPDQSTLFKLLKTSDEDLRMPQDQPSLPAGEIEKIREWIAAGAKTFPKDVAAPTEQNREPAFAAVSGVEYVLKKILAHHRAQSLTTQPFMRYFSCNHLLTRGATRQELDLQADGLAKTINHLSYEREPVPLEVIDGETASVFAVDMRKLGWHRNPLITEDTFSNVVSRKLTTHDLILLEYPYGITYDDSETFRTLRYGYLKQAKMVREIPYIRTDWFCSVALQPQLYHDIMRMPLTIDDLERNVIGVDVKTEFKNRTVQRGGVLLSGVSRNNRAAERYKSPHGAYWKSIDYASNKGAENIFRDPVNLHGVGGEMIFNLPNGLQAYYLANAKGERIDAGPTDIVTDKFADDKTVRNGLSCLRCHDRGMKFFKDVVRPVVEGLPGSLGFSKRDTLELYPPQAQLRAKLDQDSKRFLDAMQRVLGHAQNVEPLIPVSRRFLEDPLSLKTVTGELGLVDPTTMAGVFRSRQFAALGLAPLASRGSIRRDTWEDYFDQVIRELGLGEPVVPIDAVTRPNFAPLNHGPRVEITTTRGRNLAPGDKVAILVTNNSKFPVHIELTGTSSKGEIVILAPSLTVLKPGATLRTPEKGELTVKPTLGRELITVYASSKPFESGVIYRGKNTADRMVHFLPVGERAPLVKKSVVIQTR